MATDALELDEEIYDEHLSCVALIITDPTMRRSSST